MLVLFVILKKTFFQADFEQCKEELEFSQHKNCELEEIVAIERKKVKEGEEKLQV